MTVHSGKKLGCGPSDTLFGFVCRYAALHRGSVHVSTRGGWSTSYRCACALNPMRRQPPAPLLPRGLNNAARGRCAPK
eukprot:4423681-Alexandrium_andersonii.AAC.1